MYVLFSFIFFNEKKTLLVYPIISNYLPGIVYFFSFYLKIKLKIVDEVHYFYHDTIGVKNEIFALKILKRGKKTALTRQPPR